jgi:hypothetical protein
LSITTWWQSFASGWPRKLCNPVRVFRRLQ